VVAAATLMELKPAVRKVADWNQALLILPASPKPASPLSHSKISTETVPATSSTSVVVIASRAASGIVRPEK